MAVTDSLGVRSSALGRRRRLRLPLAGTAATRARARATPRLAAPGGGRAGLRAHARSARSVPARNAPHTYARGARAQLSLPPLPPRPPPPARAPHPSPRPEHAPARCTHPAPAPSSEPAFCTRTRSRSLHPCTRTCVLTAPAPYTRTCHAHTCPLCTQPHSSHAWARGLTHRHGWLPERLLCSLLVAPRRAHTLTRRSTPLPCLSLKAHLAPKCKRGWGPNEG